MRREQSTARQIGALSASVCYTQWGPTADRNEHLLTHHHRYSRTIKQFDMHRIHNTDIWPDLTRNRHSETKLCGISVRWSRQTGSSTRWTALGADCPHRGSRERERERNSDTTNGTRTWQASS